MQEAKKRVVAISNYFVSLPHPAKTTLMIAAVSFLFGVLLSLARQSATNAFSVFAGGVDGLFLLCFPALLSSTGLFLMRRKAIFRRAVFLGLITAICYGFSYLLAFSLSGFWAPAANLVFVGFGLSFVLWYFVLYLAFDFRRSAFAFSTMQLVLFAVFYLASFGGSMMANPADLLLKTYLASFVFLAALYALFYVISAPMKKNLGVSSMDAISMFLSQWLYGQKDLEEAFEGMGEEVETLVWAGRFEGKRNHALFVVPYIHFGPFGNLGGSEFTHLISQALSHGKQDVFVFHGTATHDFNPVSSDEIGRVVSACRKALQKIHMAQAKLSFSSCRVGTVRAQAYRINDSAFVSYTRAPRTTEDINLGLGLALIERAKRACKSVAVVDEHNAETGDISSVEVGNPIGFEMLDATSRLFEGSTQQKKFLFGCASDSLAIDTVGKNGLKLALFLQGRKMHALLLCDSNSIVPSFRGELLELFEALGRENGFDCHGEVMTTDTHQINNVRGVLHPLGTERRGDIVIAVRRLFHHALKRMERVKFGSAEERFRIKVFGSGQSAEIASTINSVVAILRYALPLIMVASVVLLLWAFGKL